MTRKTARTRIMTETFDPALWSIATALSAAVVYLVCLI